MEGFSSCTNTSFSKQQFSSFFFHPTNKKLCLLCIYLFFIRFKIIKYVDVQLLVLSKKFFLQGIYRGIQIESVQITVFWDRHVMLMTINVE